MAKVWTRDEIADLLATNDRAVGRALAVLYAFQTRDERASDRTVEANGVGFNAVDAEFLSSLARQFEQRKTLSPKQIYWARKALKKYVGQLVEYANEKAKLDERLPGEPEIARKPAAPPVAAPAPDLGNQAEEELAIEQYYGRLNAEAERQVEQDGFMSDPDIMITARPSRRRRAA